VRIAVTHAIYRRRAQRDLLRQRNELERLYAEATARNEELGAAKEAAERANAAKDDFLATLSHELRTPLTPVLSIVSTTLAQNYASPDLRETFAMIRRNVELEARLIDDLLDLTQIASGRLAVEKHPVDIHACIQGALEICQVAFTDKNVAVHMDLEAQDTTVLGDSPRLHQVLWNLLKNAAKFTRPDGHVEIITANEGDRIVIEIRDSGIGIEPERLESIFGAFSGVRPQPSNTGLGLGLAITRAIIEAHGGKICASSEGRGQGAVFRICLPATRASPAVTHAQADDSGRDYRGRTVLVVEDHEDTRRVMLRVLRRKGFGVTVAGDVKSACEQFEHAHPDLVICDLGLPDGTGWDVLRRLREMSPVKAIAVSGFGMEHDVRKSREAGFAAHLTKPVDFPRLEAALALVLQDDAP
jgi:signal transduction histidine kinase